jgi:hypothetical protein
MEKTIMAEIITSGDEQQNKTNSEKPKVVIAIVPQQVSNPKYSQTRSIVLEVRVPAEQESRYIEILDRLNERSVTMNEDEVDIIMDEKVGTFFPYYAKRSKPELFDLLMRKQNFALNATTAIPLFGYTQQAKEYTLDHNGTQQSIQNLIRNHPNILAVEPTASSANLGKYMVLADRDSKDEVEEYIDAILGQVPEMENQPENFKRPQRGGNAFKKNRINSIPNYLKKLEESVSIDQMLTDDDSDYSASPPIRSRRPTISYAQATKRLSFKNEMILGPNKETNSHVTNTLTTTMSTLTQDSLDATLQAFRIETEKSLNELRSEMKQEVKNMEQNIATTVIAAIQNNSQPMNMEIEPRSENESIETSTQDTTRTLKTMMDRFDILTQVVKTLAEKIAEVAENQESQAFKRNRQIDTPNRQILRDEQPETETRSPPAKIPRPTATTPPSTPPPKGHPNKPGAREEK